MYPIKRISQEWKKKHSNFHNRTIHKNNTTVFVGSNGDDDDNESDTVFYLKIFEYRNSNYEKLLPFYHNFL